MSDRSLTRNSLAAWARFIRSQAYVLSLEPQLLLQQALNRPDQDPVGAAAGDRFRRQGSPRSVIQWVNKPQANDPVLLTLNTESGTYCRFSPTDSRLLTWSGGVTSDPAEAILWDVDNGRLVGRWAKTRVSEPPFVFLEEGTYGLSLWNEGMLRLYDAESGAELQTLAKAPDKLLTFSVASGAQHLALGYQDGRVRLVDAATGAEPLTLPGHEGPVKSCWFLLGGRRLITRDESRVHLLDIEANSMLLDLPDRDGWTYDHFEVSSNEHWFALEEKNKVEGRGWTTLWETETGARGLQVTGREHAITPWGLSPKGDRVLAIEFEKGEVTRAVLELWGVASNNRELRLHLGWLSPYPPVRFSADGRWLAAGRSQPTEPGDIEVWDLRSRSEERVAHFQGHSSFVHDLAFSKNGQTLASIDADGILRLWALPVDGGSTQAAQQPRHPNEVQACVFTPDGRFLMSSSAEVQGFQHRQDSPATNLVTINPAEIRLWDAETGAHLQTIEAGQQQPNCFDFSPDTHHLAVGSGKFGGEAVRILDRGRMAVEADLGGRRGTLNGCRYTRDGRRVLSMAFSPFRSRPEDNALRIWDPITAVEVATLIGHTGEMAGFDISPNGRFAVASSTLIASAVNTPGVIADTKGDFFDALSGPSVPADLYLWDLEKRAKCASLEGCFGPTFSPDGRAVIALSGDGEWAVLWQLGSTTAPCTRAVRSGVSAGRFTPDGRELALGLKDGTVALLDPKTGAERLRLRRAGHTVHLGPFSPDGRYMIDRSSTRVGIWDVGSGEQVAAFPATAHINRVAMGSDISRLASGDKLGGVSLLRLSGIQPGPAIVTAVRVWRFAPHGIWRARFGVFSRGRMDTQPTVMCPGCEAKFVPAPYVLDALKSINGLEGDVAPSVALSRTAWDERRLFSSCDSCGTPLRFNPFIA